MKRVLVTGATGCVGRHALPLLVARGWDVTAVASRRRRPTVAGVTWHRANLLDPPTRPALVDASAMPAHLLHLAWYIAPGKWAAAPENFDWVAREPRPRRARFAPPAARAWSPRARASSTTGTTAYCSEARTPCAPHTIYGTCKHALQLLTSALDGDGSTSSAWGRIFFLYGPHEHPDRLVASVDPVAPRGRAGAYSHGKQMRDYLYAGDVADAFVRAARERRHRPDQHRVRPRRSALRDIVERIGELMGRPDLIHLGAIPAAPTDVAARRGGHDAAPARASAGSRAWISTRPDADDRLVARTSACRHRVGGRP